jgi:hypothetical protein
MLNLNWLVAGHNLPQGTTSDDVLKARAEATEGITSVLSALEQYEIVFSRFTSFRRELSDSHSRLMTTFNNLWTKLVLFLPLANTGGSATGGGPIGPVSRPTLQDVKQLEELQKALNDVCGDIGGFLIDLQIEAQNELLGELFGRQLPPRAPADPTIKVLAREPTHLTKRTPGHLA